MNAETRILQSDVTPIGNVGAAVEIRDEINAVEIGGDRAESRTTAVGRRVNDMPLAQKFGIYHATLIALFGLAFAVSFLPVISEELHGLAIMAEALIAFGGIAWVLTAARAMKRDMISPLGDLVENIGALAEGSRNIEINGTDRGDEIGRLARTTQFLLKAGAKMDELYLERKQAEEDRAASAARRKEELLAVAKQFEATVGEIAGNVATAASQLNATAAEMAASAHGSTEKAQSVVEAMDKASRSVAAAAAASDEFAMSIAEISRQATQSEELARHASKTAEGTDKTISALAESATEVNQVVELIQSIAGRTNILALNASIEAARGGEAGRGFAVVASEVKELAAKTSLATEDVGRQISTIQQSTELGVGKLREIGERVGQLETTAIAIAAAVDQQSVASRDLARSIDLSAQGTEAVSSNATELLDQASAVGAAADQLLASARDLERQAGSLTDQAKGFLNHIRAA